MPLFEAVKLAERYDLAIMSTKGMSVTAARELVDVLCGDHGIPLLDTAGTSKSRVFYRRDAERGPTGATRSGTRSKSLTLGSGYRT